MKGVSEQDKPFVFGTRLGLIIMFTALCILVKLVWKKRKMKSYH